MHFSSSTYLGLLSSSLVSAIPAELENRQAPAKCAGDNCYRYFKSVNLQSASSFCLSYLSTTQNTITITRSATVSTTPTVTVTQTISELSATTLGVLCTSTITVSPSIINKRQAPTPFSVKASSACPSANVKAQATRLSSGCRCLITSATTTITNTAVAATVTETTSVPSTATASATCSTYTTVTLNPFCQNAATQMRPCDPSIGCYRNDYPPDSTSNNGGCQGCLKHGTGCDDGQTYCIVGYRDQGPRCTYDSDCSSLQPDGNNIPFCMRYANGISFCGSNGRTADGKDSGGLYCRQRPAKITRDEEWLNVIRMAEGVTYVDAE